MLRYTFPLPLPNNDEQSFLVHEMRDFKVAVAEKHERLHVGSPGGFLSGTGRCD